VVDTRRWWVRGLLVGLDDGARVVWEVLDAGVLNRYVFERAAGCSLASRAYLVDALRSLLRWALAAGRVETDLTPGILRARMSRARLPRGLAPAQVDAMAAAMNPDPVVDARDRAVVVMLARLGLRAGEAAGLSLDDIDWAVGRLRVVGKNQRRLVLPLLDDVGRVFVAWLRLRPVAEDRAVFVRLRASIRGLSVQGISDIVKHVAERAGLGLAHSYLWRHTAAMNVISAGGILVDA